MEIVDATGEDAQGISDLLHETWLANFPNEEAGITKEDINAKFMSPEWRAGTEKRKHGVINANSDEHTWVIKAGERIIGMCIGFKEENKNWIRALYVSPDYQKRGLGKKLIEVGLEWLGNEKPIMINAATNAVDFYKSFGFTETGVPIKPSPITFLPSGKHIPEIELIRR